MKNPQISHILGVAAQLDCDSNQQTVLNVIRSGFNAEKSNVEVAIMVLNHFGEKKKSPMLIAREVYQVMQSLNP